MSGKDGYTYAYYAAMYMHACMQSMGQEIAAL